MYYLINTNLHLFNFLSDCLLKLSVVISCSPHILLMKKKNKDLNNIWGVVSEMTPPLNKYLLQYNFYK